MDPLTTAAGRALAEADPLGALKRVAVRDDAPELALGGTVMAQLGDSMRTKARPGLAKWTQAFVRAGPQPRWHPRSAGRAHG
jgi:hypothetical protein